MDFKNWLLLLGVFGVVGFSGYYIYNNPPTSPDNVLNTNPTSIPDVAGQSYEKHEDWKQFNGQTLTFYHPEEWAPENKNPYGGSVVEDINLNIPEAVDNSIFYSATAYDVVKPDDISSEKTMEINGRQWVEWIREGDGYVSYDFYTKGFDLGEDSAGSFGVHVTVNERNDDLEDKLIDLIESINFKEGEPASKDVIESATPTAEITTFQD